MSSKITKAKATAAFEAIKSRFAEYVDNGWEPPVLMEDFDGSGWTVMWEEGPDEWVYSLDGGVSEADAAMYADASAEFGVKVDPAPRAAVVMPTGVFAEPINSYSMGLYPA